MPIVYFDSSAFVKLLVEEYDSDLAAALWDLCDAAVSSRLAYPEVRAALAAAGRAGRIDETGRRSAEATWERFWAATRVVELTEVLGHRAGELAADQGLRGAELVHLASARGGLGDVGRRLGRATARRSQGSRSPGRPGQLTRLSRRDRAWLSPASGR